MLCPFCTSTFNPSIEANIIYAHHLTTKNLLASVQTGCFVCKLIWKEVQTLGNQIVWESSTPSSSSTSSLLRAFKKSSLKSPKPSDPPRLRFRFLTKIQELNFDYRVPGGWKNIVNIQLILSHGYFTENHYSYFQQFEGVDILEVPRTLHTTSTQSSECLQLAKYWIDGCTSSHRKCRSKAEVLPTRLIEVDPIVRLVNGNQLQQDGKYVALSHCWGKTPLYSLKTSTLKDFNTSIPLSNLTQSFRDAIEYTRRLRCRYIWIDSLCIIQDSLEDWERESMQMLDVYSNAWLTIAVTGFPDGLKGMFSTRPPNFDKRLPSFTIKSSSSDTPTVDTANYSCLDTNQWTEQVESAPLNRRGWVVQERVLSPRILHFGKSQIFWECNQNQASETYATGLPHSVRIGSLNKTDRGVNTVFPEWKVIIEAYSHGALTKQTDKLVAISGIARAIERNRSRATTQKDDAGNPRKYIGGLWSDYGLPDQLGWSASVMDGGGTNCTRLERYTAPTWSWACLNGAITWSVTANSGQHKIFRATTIPTVYTSPRSADEYGPVRSGVLTATGPLRRGVVFHSPQNFPAKVERYSALIAGELVELELRPDASLPGLPEIADLRLPPMDLISESSSSGQGGRRAGVSESLDELELYLLPNKIEWDEQRGPSTLSGLWLQSTNRGHAGRGEYARLGLFLMYSTADKQVWEAIEAGLPESVQNLWTTDDLLERCRAFMSLAFPIFAGFGVKQMFAENEYVKTAGKGSVTIQII